MNGTPWEWKIRGDIENFQQINALYKRRADRRLVDVRHSDKCQVSARWVKESLLDESRVDKSSLNRSSAEASALS